MFIPAAETLDTSYFVSRYVWNPEDENVQGGSDFDDMTDTCSSGSYSYTQDEDVRTYFYFISYQSMHIGLFNGSHHDTNIILTRALI